MRTIGVLLGVAVLLMLAVSAMGQEASEADLAKATQNPVGDLISVPFQNNMIFRVGKLPLNGTVQRYYNLERPEYAGESVLRLQLQFLFPK